MENESNLNSDEKRALLKKYNHRINNDLQALLGFIKLQNRFGIDKDEIITSSCVSLASMSVIQNLMYKTDEGEDLISANEFFEDFVKILNEYYPGIGFSSEIEENLDMNPKKLFHLMFLINEMTNLSTDFSFEGDAGNEISFKIERNGEECLLTYSDNGSGISETVSESSMRTLLFQQLIKQIDGNLQDPDDNSTVPIEFAL